MKTKMIDKNLMVRFADKVDSRLLEHAENNLKANPVKGYSFVYLDKDDNKVVEFILLENVTEEEIEDSLDTLEDDFSDLLEETLIGSITLASTWYKPEQLNVYVHSIKSEQRKNFAKDTLGKVKSILGDFDTRSYSLKSLSNIVQELERLSAKSHKFSKEDIEKGLAATRLNELPFYTKVGFHDVKNMFKLLEACKPAQFIK